VSPNPKTRRRWTPAPSVVGLARMRRFTGLIVDIPTSLNKYPTSPRRGEGRLAGGERATRATSGCPLRDALAPLRGAGMEQTLTGGVRASRLPPANFLHPFGVIIANPRRVRGTAQRWRKAAGDGFAR